MRDRHRFPHKRSKAPGKKGKEEELTEKTGYRGVCSQACEHAI